MWSELYFALAVSKGLYTHLRLHGVPLINLLVYTARFMHFFRWAFLCHLHSVCITSTSKHVKIALMDELFARPLVSKLTFFFFPNASTTIYGAMALHGWAGHSSSECPPAVASRQWGHNLNGMGHYSKVQRRAYPVGKQRRHVQAQAATTVCQRGKRHADGWCNSHWWLTATPMTGLVGISVRIFGSSLAGLWQNVWRGWSQSLRLLSHVHGFEPWFEA